MADRSVPAHPGDIYVAAARAEHRTHCRRCRAQHAETEARSTEYAASVQRSNRQLGLRTARTTAVQA